MYSKELIITIRENCVSHIVRVIEPEPFAGGFWRYKNKDGKTVVTAEEAEQLVARLDGCTRVRICDMRHPNNVRLSLKPKAIESRAMQLSAIENRNMRMIIECNETIFEAMIDGYCGA